MRAPTAADLLPAWERAAVQSAPQRALTLLALALPEMSDAELSQLTVGERDVGLLHLRELTFGPEMTAATKCESCDEPLEFAFAARSLHTDTPVDRNGPLTMCESNYELCFRPPTAGDLVAIASAPDADSARAQLVERCVTGVSHDGRDESVEALPGDLLHAVCARMHEADPDGDMRLALTCPACGHRWEEGIDVAAWLWTELEAWAHRTLLDVHALAAAYGWSEAEILALGSRRQLYLELVEG